MTDTPTPPMMLKQRAGLVDWLRHPCAETPDLDANDMATAADQLEADGVTIATLTAERDAAIGSEKTARNLMQKAFDVNRKVIAEHDAAQTDLKAADAQIELLLKNHNGMSAEITRLRAVIAKDAAQMIEDQHKMHEAVEVLREVIDFACALNNVAAGQNPEQLDRWSAALTTLQERMK